jgi:hypothetical protein
MMSLKKNLIIQFVLENNVARPSRLRVSNSPAGRMRHFHQLRAAINPCNVLWIN